jgi:hypothetical protein
MVNTDLEVFGEPLREQCGPIIPILLPVELDHLITKFLGVAMIRRTPLESVDEPAIA